ncbi:alpha/beta fold hydrolase [Dactylosporangium sp. CS-047395]|uniref:alpha/beta fold hydrolase n=1 Tax=Dactylosporangium sp. CS-047395 TaxID=3239936 RepID=UPI003D902C9F
MPEFVTLDGRRLEYAVSGRPDGRPVVLHHGMPGSASGPKPRPAVLYRAGIRLICYSRPGYGGSTRDPGRSVADAAEDVRALADELGLDRFAVLGRSGGGPHALACAALLPDRVTRAAALVSFAPQGAIGLDWYRDMAASNQRAYAEASDRREGDLIEDRLRHRTDRMYHDPAFLLAELEPDMPGADRRVVADPGIKRQLLETYADAVRGGADGWIDDLTALSGDWGFAFGGIEVPVRLWHGAEDRFAPASHTRWLAEHISDATVEIEPGRAHFDALTVMLDLMWWAVDVEADAPELDAA